MIISIKVYAELDLALIREAPGRYAWVSITDVAAHAHRAGLRVPRSDAELVGFMLRYGYLRLQLKEWERPIEEKRNA